MYKSELLLYKVNSKCELQQLLWGEQLEVLEKIYKSFEQSIVPLGILIQTAARVRNFICKDQSILTLVQWQ